MARCLPTPVDVDNWLTKNGRIIDRKITRHPTQHIPPGTKNLIQVRAVPGIKAKHELKVIRRNRPWTAEQLPTVRDELVEGWQFWPAEPDLVGMSEREANLLGVLSAGLWWVGSEMCKLLYATAPSVPDDVMLKHLTIPSDSGLVFLEHPWRGGVDSLTGEPAMIVDLFTWARTLVGPDRVPSVSVTSYRFIDLRHLNETDIALMAQIGLMDRLGDYLPTEVEMVNGKPVNIIGAGHWAPLGRSDWPDAHQLGDLDSLRHDAETALRRVVRPELIPSWEASILEDRQLLATFFSLLESRSLATVGEHRPSRQVVRAAQRRSQPVPSPVKIVTLRRPTRPKRERNEEPGRHVSHRFPVRAHPRMQACGPGWQDRKLITVPAHVRGPDDGPFIPKEVVHKWIR